MSNQTPSKRRKMGRDAYTPRADDSLMRYCNPWTNDDGTVVHRFDAVSKSRDFIEGWNEAVLDYELPEVPNPDPVYAAASALLASIGEDHNPVTLDFDLVQNLREALDAN